ncbi:MAG: DUF2911 domain-containing protein [Roseivirga sp.]|nr:DUF2911 domain-containing protein [Roseivirga sp.]
MRKPLFTFLIICCSVLSLQAQQPVTYTRPSQLAKVFQRIGTTDLEIIYHAPLAKGRKIFGEVVPFNDRMHDKPHPWRAGANENTVIKFNHEVSINGNPLKAGAYGLHIFVTERNWEVTFSEDYQAWGSFSYTAEKDALKVPVVVREADYQDWLSYRFLNPRDHAVTVELHWADKLIQFEISTNVHANIIADVGQLEEKNWQYLLAAANSTLKLDVNAIDEAMKLTDQSLALNETLSNRMFKVDLLEKKGNKKEAKRLKAKAIEAASPNELFSLAMSYNNKGEDKEAQKILALNLERNPEHWYAYLGYANYYRTHKDKRAIEFHEKALEYAPERGRGFANYQLGYAKRLLGM